MLLYLPHRAPCCLLWFLAKAMNLWNFPYFLRLTLYFPCLIPETVYFFKDSLFHINGLSVNYFLIVCLNNILIHFFSLGICFGFCNQFLLYARALSVHSVLNKTGVGLALGKYISCLPLCDKLPETSSLKLHSLITTWFCRSEVQHVMAKQSTSCGRSSLAHGVLFQPLSGYRQNFFSRAFHVAASVFKPAGGKVSSSHFECLIPLLSWDKRKLFEGLSQRIQDNHLAIYQLMG